MKRKIGVQFISARLALTLSAFGKNAYDRMYNPAAQSLVSFW
jgi:hypothetical protein